MAWLLRRYGFQCYSNAPADVLSLIPDCSVPRPGLLAVWFFVLWLQVVVVNVGLSGSARASKTLLYFVQVSLFLLGPTDGVAHALALVSGGGGGFLSTLCLFPRNYFGSFATQVGHFHLVLSFFVKWILFSLCV